jgi:hypothetical protein
VAVSVREAFLHDPEKGRFHVPGEPPEIAGDIQIDFDLAAFRKPLQK